MPPKTVAESPQRPPGRGALRSYRPVTTSAGKRDAEAAFALSRAARAERSAAAMSSRGAAAASGTGRGCGSSPSGREAAARPDESGERRPRRGAGELFGSPLGAQVGERSLGSGRIGRRRQSLFVERAGQRHVLLRVGAACLSSAIASSARRAAANAAIASNAALSRARLAAFSEA